MMYQPLLSIILALLVLPSCYCSCTWEEATPSCIAQKFSLPMSEVEDVMSVLQNAGKKEAWLKAVLNPRRAFLVIDMQVDFITGSLPVTEAENIVAPIQKLVEQEDLWDKIVFSEDWHPSNHISFFSNVDLRPLDPTWRKKHPGKISMFQEVVFARDPPYKQVLWPDHCVQNSTGATLHPNLTLPSGAMVLMKGTIPEVDSYSAFYDNTGVPGSGGTGLAEMISGSTEVVVVGLALDYCVGSTGLHSLEQGLPTTILSDLARPVKVETGEQMERRIKDAGGWVETSENWRASLNTWGRAKKLADFWVPKASLRGFSISISIST